MSGQVISLAPYRRARLRLVEPESGSTLLDKLRASARLVPALSDWQGKRVLVRATGITGRVEGWSLDMEKLAVLYDDNGDLSFHDAVTLQRIKP